MKQLFSFLRSSSSTMRERDPDTGASITPMVLLYSLLFAAITLPLDADPTTSGAEVLESAHMFGDNRYLEMEVRMEMKGSSTDKSREIEIKLSNDDGEYKVYMQITSPPFLRKMKFLQHNRPSGETLQWMATSRGTRKLTGAADDEHIFDSDFTASDFSALDPADYRIDSFSQVERNGFSCHRLVLSPLESGSEWPQRVVYIDRRALLIREVEYMKDGEVEKRYRLLSTQELGRDPLPKESIMEDLRAGTSTTLDFVD